MTEDFSKLFSLLFYVNENGRYLWQKIMCVDNKINVQLKKNFMSSIRRWESPSGDDSFMNIFFKFSCTFLNN